MSPLWTRRSVRWFFLIGFGLPWIGWSTRAFFDVQGPLATALFYTGDFMAVAGFVATWIAAGKPGLRSLVGRFIRWRVPVPWALFAFFLPFLWLAIPLLGHAAIRGGIGRVDPAGLLGFFTMGTLIAATTGPIGEEAGWRGFFLPRLLGRYSPLAASLILGAIWSVWHYPLYYDSVFGTVTGAVQFTISCVCFSILLTVLWAFTNGSVFWAMVLHWAVNVSPDVVAATFPDLRPLEGDLEWLSIASLVLTTIVVTAAVGLGRLRTRLDTVRAGLVDEAIDADRPT